MNFEDFARAHGLILRHVIPNRWVATPTEDHPHKRNGRYKFLGDVGWVQNWATMDSPSMWKSDVRVPSANNQRMRQAADRDRLEAQQKAATKAGWIMHQTHLAPHPYLDRKGFKDESGNVWDDNGKQLLVIPMRVDGRLVGCQLINDQGEKKFLYGQRSKGAVFMIDAKGLPIFCEGYATGLSIRTVMKAMKIRYTIYICFSASNMKDIACSVDGGIVVADNDLSKTGEQAARSTAKPYWLSDAVGEDFNDFHIRVGLFKASQSLKRVLFASGAASA
jgi:putative DNA primase/helicase